MLMIVGYGPEGDEYLCCTFIDDDLDERSGNDYVLLNCVGMG